MRINIWVLVAIIMLSIMPAGVQAQSDEGLVAEWHFDEGAGSVVEDSSGNGNDGVIYGATWVDGKFGKALSFDGVDDYVDLPIRDINSAFSQSVWIKTNAVSTNSVIRHYILTVQKNPPNGGYYTYQQRQGFIIAGDSIVGQYWNGAGDSDVLSSSGSISPGVWYFVVLTGDSSGGRLYINGALVDSKSSVPSSSIVATQSYIGLRGDAQGNDYFNGIIDEVRIYNRALSPEEIRQHYESGPTALSLTKTASPQSIKQGQTATITLTVKNTGSTEISDIEIADTIPSYLTFIDGETSKTYDSLAPKDTRQISYTLQFNDAGTFNFEPAIATYADDKGNYNTVKSKPASIEVIRSIIENSAPTPKPTNGNVQSASVHLHGEKTDVVMGEDILLKLAAVNLITKPTMHVQIIITPPSGMSVTSSEFVQSGAGLFTASYEIEPGVGRDIEVKMRSNQVGDFVVNGRIVYYFGDDMEHAEDHTLTLPITVRAGAESIENPTESSSESDEPKTPGFAAVVAVIGLLAVYLRRKRV